MIDGVREFNFKINKGLYVAIEKICNPYISGGCGDDQKDEQIMRLLELFSKSNEITDEELKWFAYSYGKDDVGVVRFVDEDSNADLRYYTSHPSVKKVTPIFKADNRKDAIKIAKDIIEGNYKIETKNSGENV